MEEYTASMEREDDSRDFEGNPYLFEPEYTDEELAEMDRRRAAEEEEAAAAAAAAPANAPIRCEGDWWCGCGRCQPMATEDECLCCCESDVFRNVLHNTEARCVTATEEFPPLITPGVVRTFFHVPKINWKKRPVPEGPNGQLSAK